MTLPTDVVCLILVASSSYRDWIRWSMTCRRLRRLCYRVRDEIYKKFYRKLINETGEVEWLDGHRHGLEIQRYPSGQCRLRTQWYWDKLDGLELGYYESGDISHTKVWRHDRRSGWEVHWYPSGRLQLRHRWRHNRLDGLELKWYSSGRLQTLRQWREGILNGLVLEWDSTGDLHRIAIYLDGCLNGIELLMNHEWTLRYWRRGIPVRMDVVTESEVSDNGLMDIVCGVSLVALVVAEWFV